MTVDPGFAGQRLIPSTVKKIEQAEKWLDMNGYADVEIEADGNVSFENAAVMSKAGANVFVAGTSSIFKKDVPLDESIPLLKSTIEI